MATNPFESVNKLINATVTEIVDTDVTNKVASIINTVVTSSVEVVDDFLKKVKDLTKPDEP
jgi:hypothetical protein